MWNEEVLPVLKKFRDAIPEMGDSTTLHNIELAFDHRSQGVRSRIEIDVAMIEGIDV